MKHNAVARRYASALFQLAREQQSLDRVASDIRYIGSFLESEELRKVLGSQRFSTRRKKKILKELWGANVSPMVLAFLGILVEKHRERYLGEILDVFIDLLREERNIAVAEVKTAFPLDQQTEERVRRALEKHTGKQIEMRVSVHPELIGGLVVKVGDRVMDGSVAKRLALLGTRLAERSLGKLEVGT